MSEHPNVYPNSAWATNGYLTDWVNYEDLNAWADNADVKASTNKVKLNSWAKFDELNA